MRLLSQCSVKLFGHYRETFPAVVNWCLGLSIGGMIHLRFRKKTLRLGQIARLLECHAALQQSGLADHETCLFALPPLSASMLIVG